MSLLHLFVNSIQKEIDPQEVCFQIIQKLKNIRDIANQSIFFKNYKVNFSPMITFNSVGSSTHSEGKNPRELYQPIVIQKYHFFSLLVHRCCSSWKPTVSM